MGSSVEGREPLGRDKCQSLPSERQCGLVRKTFFHILALPLLAVGPWLGPVDEKDSHGRGGMGCLGGNLSNFCPKLSTGPFSTPVPFLQSVPLYPCGVSSSGAEKRKHSTAFPEASFLETSSGPVGSQYGAAGAASSEGQSGQPLGPCSSTQHLVALPSGAQPVHSSPVFPPSQYPNGSAAQQPMLPQYGGRKILVCSVDNCYCSSVANHGGHQPYPRSGHFPWTVPSQEYSHPLPPTPSVPQSLPGLAVRDWLDASQQPGHQDFYRVYGQPSTKHYVTS